MLGASSQDISFCCQKFLGGSPLPELSQVISYKWDLSGFVHVLHPTPVLLPGKSHGQRSLVGCSPWGRWGSDMTERLHFHFSLWCIGEGNGNPLQCSCLENPRDGGAWWAAFYGVTQSRTRLKWLSSSSSSSCTDGPTSHFWNTFFLLHNSFAWLAWVALFEPADWNKRGHMTMELSHYVVISWEVGVKSWSLCQS